MTLNEIIEIQATIDKRKPAKDTIEVLNNQYYYSKSKGLNIKLADMHINHFLRAIKISNKDRKLIDIETQEIINQQKKTLRNIKRLLNEQ